MATLSTNFGRITIGGNPYTIVPDNQSYDVKETPAHADVDQKLERRVIHINFSAGIQKRREEPSIDATAISNPSFSYNRQTKVTQGFWWANGCDTRSQDRIFAQRANTSSNFSDPVQTPFIMLDGNTFSYAVSQNAVYALTTAPGTWSTSVTTIPTITDTVNYGGFVYLAVGNNNSFYTWDQTTLTTNWVQRTNVANNFIVVREQLWRSAGANLYSTVNTNPANQVWSTATVVGNPNTNINYLDLWEDFLMIFKQDGIYNMDKTGNVYPILPGFKNLGTNPRPIGQWRDNYYFASDVGLIWELTKTKVNRIGFDLAEPYPMGGTTTLAPVFGTPNAIPRGVATTNYLIVGFNQYPAATGAGCYYLAYDGQGWHPFAFFQSSTASSVGMTGGNTNPVVPILQFSLQNTGGNAKIYYQNSPLVDSFLAKAFDTSPQVLYMTAGYGALEDESKVLERVNIWVDNPASGTVRIAYSLDDNIAAFTFNDLGVPTGDGVSGSQQFNPPLPLPTYRKEMLRLTTTANSSTTCPVVRYIILHYKQRTPQRKIWTLQLLADKNTINAQGRQDSRGPAKIIDDLNTARQNHQQVAFVDQVGISHQVYVDEVGERIQVLKGNTDPNFIVTVILVEAASEQIFQ